MKRKFICKLLCATLLGVSGAWFTSCKDFEPDIRTEFQQQLSNGLGNLDEVLEEQIDALEAELRTLEGKLAKIEPCDCSQDDINKIKKDIEALQKQISNWEELERRVKDLEDKPYLTEETLKDILPAILEELGYKKGASDLTEDDVNRMIQDAINTASAQFEQLIQSLEAKFGDYYTKDYIDNLAEGLNDLISNTYTKADVDSIAKELVKADELKEKVENILKELEYVDREELNDSLNSLAETLREEFKKEIERLDKKIDKVDALLKQVLNSMITGIIINATENPVFGSASLPADVRTTVLAAYYGKAVSPFTFPNKADFSGISIGDQIGADAGEYLFNDKKGNAGKIYLTINPNTVNFQGQALDLVTSQGNASPIKLDTLSYSEKELSFGWTRAASDNGFYEAPATLAKEDIQKVTANIDMTNIRSSVNEVLKERSKTSIAKLAATLFNESSDILPAYAVRASWSYDEVSETGDTNTVKNNVLSQYALAATAVNPLSYNFMENAQYTIPFLERFENLVGSGIDGLFNQIKDAMPDFSNVSVPEFKIELSDDTKNQLIIHCEIEIPEGELTGSWNKDSIKVTDSEGNDIGWADITGIEYKNNKVIIGYDLDLTARFESIIGDINGSLNDSDLQAILDELTKFSKIGSDLDDIRDNIKNKIFGYIDRLNSSFSNLVSSVNTSLQPCMLFLNDSGEIAGRLTTSPTGSRVSGTSITLAPTSYTAELFAPAYKKFVAVTAINGSTAGCDSFNSSNKDLATILDGDVDKITINGLESGNVYKITYSAVDYHGLTRTKNYYISVVK